MSSLKLDQVQPTVKLNKAQQNSAISNDAHLKKLMNGITSFFQFHSAQRVTASLEKLLMKFTALLKIEIPARKGACASLESEENGNVAISNF